MDISLELSKQDKMLLLRQMEKAALLASEEFFSTMTEQTEFLKSNIEIRTPVWKGPLRASIASQVIRGFNAPGLIRGSVATGLKYGPAMEEGSKPHFPPIKALTGKIESLDLWAKDKGLPAFVVARAIAKKGTKPRRMFRTGFQVSKQQIIAAFNKAAAEFIKKLRK